MNRRQAQETLLLYRPGTADALDPAFKEALEIAHRHNELARWLKNHCANHKIVRGALKQIQIPAGFKEQILSERPPLATSPWKKRALVSMSATFALFFGVILFWQMNTKENDSAFRNRMVSTALRSYGMDLETADLNKILAFLAEQNAPAEIQLPGKLHGLQPTGCVVLRWQNQPVSMICFRSGRPLSPGETSDVFLFIVEKSFKKDAPQSVPTIQKVNRLMTASWSEGDKSFLLATPGSQSYVKELL